MATCSRHDVDDILAQLGPEEGLGGLGEHGRDLVMSFIEDVESFLV